MSIPSETKKKVAVTSLCCSLLLLLYSMIFGFSAQDGETSGGLSRLVSERCVEVLNALTGKHWSEAFRESLATYFEHPIRKLAHFGEYACMGILVYGTWVSWIRGQRNLLILTVCWVFVSAAADELHQLFVPGRWASFADVCLDTAGGAFGFLVIWCIRRILSRIKSWRRA